MKKYRVYLGACPSYEPVQIQNVIREGLTHLSFSLPASGRIVIKPNLVMAHPKIATDSYTRPEIIEGILANLSIHHNVNIIKVSRKLSIEFNASNNNCQMYYNIHIFYCFETIVPYP